MGLFRRRIADGLAAGDDPVPGCAAQPDRRAGRRWREGMMYAAIVRCWGAMSRGVVLHAAALALCVLVLVGCTGGSRADERPTGAAPLVQTSVPAPTSATSVQAGAAGAATAPPAASPAPALPTPAPTITVRPTAAPFPLQAGWWDKGVCYEIFVR